MQEHAKLCTCFAVFSIDGDLEIYKLCQDETAGPLVDGAVAFRRKLRAFFPLVKDKGTLIWRVFSLIFIGLWLDYSARAKTHKSAMKSQNLDRSSSPLAHVSVDQMSNSTLLRRWYVCSGRVGMNKYLHGLLSSIQPEHRTPGHGSSYDILACIVFSSFNEIVEFDISKREAGQS